MAASDNLSPQQFFHGTAHKFIPGDLVHPASAIGGKTNYAVSDRRYVNVTTSPGTARWYAEGASLNSGGKRSPRVYEVEPTGDVRPYRADDEYVSSDPMRVVREHHTD